MGTAVVPRGPLTVTSAGFIVRTTEEGIGMGVRPICEIRPWTRDDVLNWRRDRLSTCRIRVSIFERTVRSQEAGLGTGSEIGSGVRTSARVTE